MLGISSPCKSPNETPLLTEFRRKWSNPEVLIFKYGIRLHTLEAHKIAAILKLVEVSLSEAGYQKVISAMEVNHFLGELVNAAPIMNRYSYQYVLHPCIHVLYNRRY